MIKRQVIKQIMRSIVKSSVTRVNNAKNLEASDSEPLMLSTLKQPVMNPAKLKLIPDDREYREEFIDRYIAWILNNDPQTPFKSESMLKANYDIEVFNQRIAELDLEYHRYHQQRAKGYRAEIESLQTARLNIDTTGRPQHEAQQLIAAARSAKKAEITANYEEDLAALDREYAIIKQQYESRISPAREDLN
ncbi:hypothetical protein [Chamaesiphon polymorphus]|uniref:Uncharacterized protein n=1 Tax=Chamaesiphon polymorphus CCALA 037 TaxID=2107692 RepID=A0A2T1FH00_9CYAN|nr:hypothetical protein [Chamaesiphon polymorphus]PSB44260.1 hypothetical protein C7B77_25715 [Chamaesiphon polymorphus CCALA 037]